MIAAQRTGSNLLLGSFPPDEFEDLGEVFRRRDIREHAFSAVGIDIDRVHELRFSDPGRFIDQILAEVAQSTGRHLLWKVQYQNLFYDGDYQAGVSAALSERPDIPVIHLVRENLVERYVSQKVANATGQYRLTTSRSRIDPPPLIVKPRPCLENLQRTAERMELVEQRFARERFVRVAYEELVADREQVAERISETLGIPVTFAPPITLKQGRPLAETVGNLAELQAALEGTPWEGQAGVGDT